LQKKENRVEMGTMNYQIKNVRIIDSTQDRVGDVFIENGKIVDSIDSDYEEIDGTGKILFPGLIDPHVHFRDPGLTHKEDLFTGSRSAVAGGVTTFFEMPNTKPPTFTLENLEQKRALAREKSCANFGFYFGAGMANAEEIAKVTNVPGVKLYLNTTTGDLKMDQEDTWRTIFNTAKRVLLHAEGETFARAIAIWKEEDTPCEVHLCHVSLASEVALLRELKQSGYVSQISAEACPHHLLLTEKDSAQMKPPLATQADQEALWEGIKDGTIDIFATDHAPHTKEEKESFTVPFGVPGVETMLPLLFMEFQKRGLSLKKLAHMTSSKTAELFHVVDKKGKIEFGFDADLVLWDLTPSVIDASKSFSKAKYSPFDGWEVLGQVEKTFIDGQLIFEKGRFVAEDFRGKEIQFKLPQE
jgi:dihydroorotase